MSGYPELNRAPNEAQSIVPHYIDLNGNAVPFPVDAGGRPITAASGQSVEVAVPLVVTAAAYAAGNIMGGVIAFSSALRSPSLSGILNSVRVSDKKANTDGRVLWLFNANPTASTFTDKAAPGIAAADIPKIIGRFVLGVANSDLGTHAHYETDGIGKVVQAAGTTLYGVLITQGTPTPTTTGDIAVAIGMVQD
jgi:hypothetical protein